MRILMAVLFLMVVTGLVGQAHAADPSPKQVATMLQVLKDLNIDRPKREWILDGPKVQQVRTDGYGKVTCVVK